MADNPVARALGRASFAGAFCDTAYARAMLAFERALAQAQADAGLIPAAAALSVAAACDALYPPSEQLVDEARRSGSLAIPLVKALTEEVRKHDAAAAAYVHYGSTSQDVLDTALVLCLQPCLEAADRVLGTAAVQLAAHARKHARVLMLGRTLLQPASPITAGLKIARWPIPLVVADRGWLQQPAVPCACNSAGRWVRWIHLVRSAPRFEPPSPGGWASPMARPGTRSATPCSRSGRNWRS